MLVDGLHAVLVCGLFLGSHLTYLSVAAWLAGHCAMSLVVDLLHRPDEDRVWGDRVAVRRQLVVAAALGLAGFAVAAVEGKARYCFTAFVSCVASDVVVLHVLGSALQEFPALASLSQAWGTSVTAHAAFGLAAVMVLGGPASDGFEPRSLAELARQALEGRVRGRAARAFLGGPLAAAGQVGLLRARDELGWLVHGLLTALLCSSSAALSPPPPAALAAMAAPWVARVVFPANRHAEWALLAAAAMVLLSPGKMFAGHVWSHPLLGIAFASFLVAAWRLR